MKPKSKLALRLLLMAYGLSVVLFALLLVSLGRRGLIERFTFAPHMLSSAPSFRQWTDRKTGVYIERRLPPAQYAVCGPEKAPVDVVIFADAETPIELVVFVCPGAGGAAESHAAQFWMRIPFPGLLTASFRYPGVVPPGEHDALPQILPAARAALALVRARAPEAPLVLVGTSLGAAPAMALAEDAGAVGLVLDTPADLRHEITRRTWLNALPPLFLGTTTFFAAGVPDDLAVLERVDDLPADLPVLLSVSDRDPVVDPRRVRLLADRLGVRARLWVRKETGHAFLLTGMGFHSEIKLWIREVVLGMAPPESVRGG